MVEEKHPFKTIRHSNKLSQAQVANESGLTPQVVLRSEQGLYGMPTPKLTAFLSKLDFSAPVAELEKQYRTWQTMHRLYGQSKIEPAIMRHRAEYPNRIITMPQFRQSVLGISSVVGMCKLLCIHPSQVDRYTRRGGSIYFLEEALRDVCSEDLVQWVKQHLRPS